MFLVRTQFATGIPDSLFAVGRLFGGWVRLFLISVTMRASYRATAVYSA